MTGAAGETGETGQTEGERGFRDRALGQIAIRCADMEGMERFYGGVIGLDLLARRPGGITFLRIAAGHAGHTAVLALFAAGDPDPPAARPGASLHHLALALGWEEQERVFEWDRRIGQPHRLEHFDWIGWRAVFTSDPEGNTVELVAARPGTAA